MRISSTSNPARLVLGALRGDLIRGLRVGQRLAAVVLESNQRGILKLSIGATVVTAQTSLQLAPGTKITLEVVHAGRQPELKLVPSEEAPHLRTEALKTSLPRQIPLPQALQQLAATLSAGQNATMSLPPAIRDALRTLFNGLSRNDPPVSAETLRQQVQNSGIFLEASLLGKAAIPRDDLKAALLRLYRLIQNTRHNGSPDGAATAGPARNLPLLTSLEQSLGGALARIRLDQLAALDKDGLPTHQWHIDLPLRNGERFESLHLRIQKETAHSKKEKDPPVVWNVTLDFDLEPVGPFQAHIRLTGEEVATHFTVERPPTKALIERHLARLHEAFEKVGLRVTQLDTRVGRRSEPSPWDGVERLLDEKA